MSLFFRFTIFSFCVFLAGCPQGSANDVFRLDGGDAGDDADAGVAEENDAGGTGALCGADGRDECGSLSTCDPKLGCVECRSDDDCPIAAARCLLGACVGCRPGKTDCPEGSACSVADFECHPRCVGPGECSGATICDETSGECVGCLGDHACAGMKCSPDKRDCVECIDDESCPSSRPRCRIATGACVGCRSNDDCGVSAPFCDPVDFSCRVPKSAEDLVEKPRRGG
jgi:hypothetical protein